MTDETAGIELQNGRLGRVAVVRLRPNLDMVSGVEEAARQTGFSQAIVRSAVGSLVDACLEVGGRRAGYEGPGVEILSLTGEVGPRGAILRGTISTPTQTVHGGLFVRGENAICITLELVLQEWLPESPPE